MIALRRNLERGLRHPLFGPLCLLLLALLLAFTVMHSAHDQMHAGSGDLMVCVAFLIGAIVSLALPRMREIPAMSRRIPRGPPAVASARLRPLARRSFASAPVPLRL